MFKIIKSIIQERKEETEFKRKEKDIIQFTVRDINTKKEETLIMDRLGYNNYMVYSYLDKELINAKVIRKA